MIDDNLKQLPLVELPGLLVTAQRNVALATLYNHGAVVIQQNKNSWIKCRKLTLTNEKTHFLNNK